MARRVREPKGNDTIYGTDGDNILDGTGGSFDLIGGKGNDTYIVDDAGDKVIEKNRGGTDLVISSIDFVQGKYVENLTLVGADDLSGTGNDSDNIIIGNSGANALYGLGGDDSLSGGDGSDFIDGGDGVDTAVFDGASGDYVIELDGTDIRVTYIGGGTDILRNIEFLAFDDVVIAAADIGGSEPGDPPAPVAVDDTAGVAEDNAIVISVLANDSGDGLSITAVNNGATGQVTINAGGTVTYAPDANTYGPDSFSYTVTDSLGRISTASVVVNVSGVNDAPVAGADSYSALSGEVFASAGSVLDNDSDVDGDALTVTAYDAISQANGTVLMNADGTFTYTPENGFTGADSFTYTVGDDNGGQATATASITVEDAGAVPYYVEGLLYSEEWRRMNYPDDVGTGIVVTYAFLTEVPDYYDWEGSLKDSFSAFTAQQEQVTRDALALIESSTDITFVETTVDAAGVTFGLADLPGVDGLAYKPMFDGVGSTASDVWLDAAYAGDALVPGTDPYTTLLHEIGHALGLAHPSLPVGEENQQYTVMDGLSHPTMSGSVDVYQLYDIAALQYLYGTNTSYATGNDVYGFSAFDGMITTIWDAGGYDVIDMSGATYAVDLDLAEGAFSTVAATGSNNLAIAFGTVIEDAIGSDYNDRIVGNDAANRLTGGGGDDELTGRGGVDIFVFAESWGNDTITDFFVGEDQLDFAGAGLVFADLEITPFGGDTLIAYFGDSVTLQGVAAIEESNFVFA